MYRLPRAWLWFQRPNESVPSEPTALTPTDDGTRILPGV